MVNVERMEKLVENEAIQQSFLDVTEGGLDLWNKDSETLAGNAIRIVAPVVEHQAKNVFSSALVPTQYHVDFSFAAFGRED